MSAYILCFMLVIPLISCDYIMFEYQSVGVLTIGGDIAMNSRNRTIVFIQMAVKN